MTEKKHTNDTAAPLRIAGLGMPMIDFFAPTEAELMKGEALIAEATTKKPLPGESAKNKEILDDLKAHGLVRAHNAKVALRLFHTFIETHGFGPGNKRPLTEDQAIEIAQLFDTMVRGATDIKRAAAFLGRPEEGLDIRGVGGTTTNKLHCIQSGLGDRVKTHQLGIVGNEDDYGNREKLLTELATCSKIDFEHFHDASLEKLACGYILQKDGDRIALKSYLNPLKEILTNHTEQVHDFAKNKDAFLIEGGDFSDVKFGNTIFSAYEKEALNSRKPIFMGLPTELGLVLNTPREPEETRTRITVNRERVMQLVMAPNTAIIGCNEEESVAFFCNEPFNKDLSPTLKDHPQVKQALITAKQVLQIKYERQPSGSPEPLCLITIGKEGAYAVTPSGITFEPSVPEKQKINNLGAGDAFFGGAVIHYIQHVLEPARRGETPAARHSEDFLHALLHVGQKLGSATIEYKGAELPPARIASLVHGTPPEKAPLANAPLTPSKDRGVA